MRIKSVACQFRNIFSNLGYVDRKINILYVFYHILPMHDHILGVQESIVEEFSIKEKGFKIKKLFLVLKITKNNYKALHFAL